MSRTYTVLNQAHPRNILNAHLNDLRKKLRLLSTQDLLNALRASAGEGATIPTVRHHMLDALIEHGKAVFKQQWKENYDWDFDECFDNHKLNMRVWMGRERHSFIVLRGRLNELMQQLAPMYAALDEGKKLINGEDEKFNALE